MHKRQRKSSRTNQANRKVRNFIFKRNGYGSTKLNSPGPFTGLELRTYIKPLTKRHRQIKYIEDNW